MPFAVELLFDETADEAARAIWSKVEDLGLSDVMPKIGARPHISIGVCRRIETERFQPALAAFAARAPALEFKFTSVGTFPSSEGVVFLAPVVTATLLDLHKAFHSIFAEHAISP